MPGHKPYVPNGKSGAEIRAHLDAIRDSTPLITRCAFCDWTYEGTALEGRELAKGHRRVKHPEVKPVRRRRGSLSKFQNRDDHFREPAMRNAAEVAEMVKRRDAEAA